MQQHPVSMSKTSQPAPNVFIQSGPLPAHHMTQQSLPPGHPSFAPRPAYFGGPGQVPSPSMHQAMTPGTPSSEAPPSYPQLMSPMMAGGGPGSVPPAPRMMAPLEEQQQQRAPPVQPRPPNTVFREILTAEQMDALSPLELSNHAKDLVQDIISKMADNAQNFPKMIPALHLLQKMLGLKNADMSQQQQQQTRANLAQFQDTLRYVQTSMENLVEVRKRLVRARMEKQTQGAELISEQRYLDIITADQPMQVPDTNELRDLTEERNHLCSQLAGKNAQLQEMMQFMQSLEWEIGCSLDNT